MVKRGISLILALLLCLSLLPLTVLAEEAELEILYPAGDEAEMPASEPSEAPAVEAETPAADGAGSVAIDETNFPDANFRSYVSEQFDTDGDGSLAEAEINAVSYIDVGSKDVADLRGIEYFTALTTLNCYTNQLTALDLKTNTALTWLDCSGNQLTALDVSANTALTKLLCENNQLTALDVNANTALVNFEASGNAFAITAASNRTFDLSTLAGFDVSKASAWTGGTVSGTTLTVNEGAESVGYTYDCGQGQSMDVTLNVTVAEPKGIAIDERNFPDEIFRSYISANFDADADNFLSDEEIAAVTSIQCRPPESTPAGEGPQIATLQGLEYFTALKVLNCRFHALTELDLSANTALETVDVVDNDLVSLTVSGCSKLRELNCAGNALVSLDVSGLTALESIRCKSNKLTVLNVSGCEALTFLTCSENSLSSLDVNGLIGLKGLYCDMNSLTSLDVSGCTALGNLFCGNNALASLEQIEGLAGCGALYYLACGNNGMTTLDVSALTTLTMLECEGNALSSLDVSALESLMYLHCGNNVMTALNINGCAALKNLKCDGNAIPTLDISANPLLLTTLQEGSALSSDNGVITYWVGGDEFYYDTSESYIVADSATELNVSAEADDHSHDGITYLPFDSAAGFPREAGTYSYYLTEDTQLSMDWTNAVARNQLTEGIVLNLCLNGYDITVDSSLSSAICVDAGATLNLCDCQNCGIVGGATTAYPARGLNILGVVNMSGGTITGNGGYGVYVGGGGEFNMSGGTITGNGIGEDGWGKAGVYVCRDVEADMAGVVNISGGEIRGEICGLYIEGGDATLSGSGSIIGNKRGVYMLPMGTKVNGSLLISGGSISENHCDAFGAGIFVYKSALTMTGGEISDNSTSAAAGGGVAMTDYATFSMSGGTISGNRAEGTDTSMTSIGGGGGGIYAAYSSVVTVSGGEIRDNSAALKGGGIYARHLSKVYILGGDIIGNEAGVAGGGVYDSTIYLSGATQIRDNLCAGVASNIDTVGVNNAGGGITLVGPLTEGASVGVTLNSTSHPVLIVPADGVSAASSLAYVFSDSEAYVPKLNSSGQIEMVLNPDAEHAHVLSAVAIGPPAIAFEALAERTDGVLPAGQYYLQEDLQLAEGETLSFAGDTTLCLNGHNIIGAGDVSVLKVPAGVTVNICDCNGSAQSNRYTVAGDGRWIPAADGAMSVNGGAIVGGSAARGGGAYVEGTLYLHAASIVGNCASEFGGGVYVTDGAVFEVSESGPNQESTEKPEDVARGVLGNTAVSGGGVYAAEGSMVWLYSAIKGNVAASAGGGAMGAAGSTIYVSCAVTSNTAAGTGGGLCSYGSLTLGSAYIYNNRADNGGGLYIPAGVSVDTVSRSLICGNSAETYGGAVYLEGTFELGDCQMTNNEAGQRGGGIYTAHAGRLILSETPDISNNRAAETTDNVYLSRKTQIEIGETGLVTEKLRLTRIGVNTQDKAADVTAESDWITAKYLQYFTADRSGDVLSVSGNKIVMNGGSQYKSHSDHGGLVWTEWSDPDSLPTQSGNYYLACDVTLEPESYCGIGAGEEVNLCLNGCSVYLDNSTVEFGGSGIAVEGTLKLHDCGAEQGAIVARHSAIIVLQDGRLEGYNCRFVHRTTGTVDSMVNLAGDAACDIYLHNGGAAYFENCRFENDGAVVSFVSGQDGGSVSTSYTNIMSVASAISLNNCHLSATGSGAVALCNINMSGGSLSIVGGSFTAAGAQGKTENIQINDYGGSLSSATSLQIRSGYFSANGGEGVTANLNSGLTAEGSTLSIANGTFLSSGDNLLVTADAAVPLVLSGGYYSADPSAAANVSLAEGYAVTDSKLFEGCSFRVALAEGEKKLTDENDRGVTVSGSGTLDMASALQVQELPSGDYEIQMENMTVEAFEITLVDESGAEVQPDGDVTVSIPVPTGMDGSKCRIYHMVNGVPVNMNAQYNKSTNCLVFITHSFSVYLVAETGIVAQPDLRKNGWQQVEDYWFYVRSGKALTGWQKLSAKWYYFDADGIMQTGFTEIDGETYYLNSSGAMKTGWLEIGGEWYYFASSGVMKTGWLKSGGKWYHFDASGVMQTGWIEVDGETYFMATSGAMKTGWAEKDEQWVYLTSSGLRCEDWLKSGGKWYYFGADGYMETGWQEIDGAKYYFTSSGAMLTGWQRIGGQWYYFASSGAMQTGWLKSGGKWYYMNAEGVMQTGWIDIGGAKYFMNSAGAMLTGWQRISGQWYYFASSGAMKTGWLKSGGKWYYLDIEEAAKGVMLSSTTREIDGVLYKFNASGVWVG